MNSVPISSLEMLAVRKLQDYNAQGNSYAPIKAKRTRRKTIFGRKKTWKREITKYIPGNYKCNFKEIEWKQAINVTIANYAKFKFKKTENLKALVLDGAGAGTTTVFTRFGGFKAGNITALSSQDTVAESIKKKFPTANVFDENLKEFIDDEKKGYPKEMYDVVYVDLCGTWQCHKDQIFATLFATKSKAIFAFAVSQRPFKTDTVRSEFEAHWKNTWGGFKFKHKETIKTKGKNTKYFVMIYEFNP